MIGYNLENHLHWISLLTLKSNKGHIVWPQAVSRSTKNSENMFFKYNQTDSFSLLLKDGSFDPIQRWRSHLSYSIRPHFPTPFQLNLKKTSWFELFIELYISGHAGIGRDGAEEEKDFKSWFSMCQDAATFRDTNDYTLLSWIRCFFRQVR